jgi:hypothetical protein
VDFSKLSREDLMVGGGGLVLLIGMLAFPWFSTHPFGAFHYTTPAIDGPGSAWAILAVIVLFWVLVDLGLARFSPATVIPTTKYGREMTRAIAIAAIVGLVFIRLIWHIGDWGWGFFVDLILLALVAVGAWFNAIGRRTPVGTRPS